MAKFFHIAAFIQARNEFFEPRPLFQGGGGNGPENNILFFSLSPLSIPYSQPLPIKYKIKSLRQDQAFSTYHLEIKTQCGQPNHGAGEAPSLFRNILPLTLLLSTPPPQQKALFPPPILQFFGKLKQPEWQL